MDVAVRGEEVEQLAGVGQPEGQGGGGRGRAARAHLPQQYTLNNNSKQNVKYVFIELKAR